MRTKQPRRGEPRDDGRPAAALGYALAASAPHRQGHRSLDDLLRKMCDTTPTRAPGLGLPLGRWVAPLQELLSELLLAVSEEQSLVKL